MLIRSLSGKCKVALYNLSFFCLIRGLTDVDQNGATGKAGRHTTFEGEVLCQGRPLVTRRLHSRGYYLFEDTGALTQLDEIKRLQVVERLAIGEIRERLSR